MSNLEDIVDAEAEYQRRGKQLDSRDRLKKMLSKETYAALTEEMTPHGDGWMLKWRGVDIIIETATFGRRAVYLYRRGKIDNPFVLNDCNADSEEVLLAYLARQGKKDA